MIRTIINRIKLKITNATDYLYTLFYYDFSIRGVIEASFPICIAILYLVNKYYLSFENKSSKSPAAAKELIFSFKT